MRGNGVRIRWAAHGLLLGSALLFIGLSFWPEIPFWGQALRAAAEAATIGALADWFAVTALFRRPLGLPIPHTALLPRNKARIGQRLGRFVVEKFLDPEKLVHRLADENLFEWLAGVLQTPAVRQELGGLIAIVLDETFKSLRSERQKTGLKSEIAKLLTALDLAPPAARSFFDFLHAGQYRPWLDRIAAWGEVKIDRERLPLKEFLYERVVRYLANKFDSGLIRRMGIKPSSLAQGAIARWIADALAEAILTDALDGLTQLRAPDSPLSHKFHALLLQQAHQLTRSDDWTRAWDDLKQYFLAPERFDPAFDRLWTQGQAALIAARPKLEEACWAYVDAQIARLRTDPAFRATLSRWAEKLSRRLIAHLRPLAAHHIAATVTAWEDSAVTLEMERSIGRDLQYIRINGTLIGGLAGVTLFLIDLVLLS